MRVLEQVSMSEPFPVADGAGAEEIAANQVTATQVR